MVVAPGDVPADHAGLFPVAGVVGAVQGEVPQGRELRLYAVNQEEFVGVYAISTLFALAQVPTRASLRVVRCGM